MPLNLFSSNKSALVFGAAMMALVANGAVSDEQAQAANEELTDAGITGAQLITQAGYTDLTERAGRAATAEAARTQAAASLEAVNAALTAAGAKDVAELVRQRDEARQQAADFGSQPGALGTTATKDKADVSEEGGDENEKLVAALHEKMLQG